MIEKSLFRPRGRDSVELFKSTRPASLVNLTPTSQLGLLVIQKEFDITVQATLLFLGTLPADQIGPVPITSAARGSQSEGLLFIFTR